MTLAPPLPPDAWSNDAIAARLVALREARGMNQREFAAHLGLGFTAWNNYELALSRISLDAARKVVAGTGASLDWIYYGNPAGMPLNLMSQIQAVLRQAG